jgi:hypothetical protein
VVLGKEGAFGELRLIPKLDSVGCELLSNRGNVGKPSGGDNDELMAIHQIEQFWRVKRFMFMTIFKGKLDISAFAFVFVFA